MTDAPAAVAEAPHDDEVDTRRRLGRSLVDATVDPENRHRIVLAAIVVGWSLLFFWLTARRHVRYGTFGFDLGTYDQGVWLLSQFKEPFVTVRGLNLFGHHLNASLILIAPLYWFGGGPLTLLAVQIASQAAGAVAIYLLARDRLLDKWLAVVMALVLLLHPTYQFLVWEFFHPDALALGPLLFAYWAARTGRWRIFLVTGALAVACKEDVALSMAMIGLLLFLWGRHRQAVITLAASVGWYLFATRVLMTRALGGHSPFYDTFFGDFGNSASEVVKNIILHPATALEVATRPDRTSFYRMMLAPFAFLAVLDPAVLVAVPMLAVDAFTTFPYAREITYHYAALVVAGFAVATVEAIARLSRQRPGAVRFLVGLVAATSFASTVAWGPSPVSTKYHAGWWPNPDGRIESKQAAKRLVPSDAPVSVTYYFTPQMTHRERIYEFPEPWKAVNWGIDGRDIHNPAVVDWIVLDRQTLNDRDRALVRHLIDEGEFEIVFDRQDIIVAERVGRGGRVDVDALTPIPAGAPDAP